MQIGKFNIEGENCFNLISAELEDAFKVRYATRSANNRIYFFEDGNLVTTSSIMIVAIVERINNFLCSIEIVSGGGADSLLSMALGNESRLIKRIYDVLANFCSGLDYKISELRIQ